MARTDAVSEGGTCVASHIRVPIDRTIALDLPVRYQNGTMAFAPVRGLLTSHWIQNSTLTSGIETLARGRDRSIPAFAGWKRTTAPPGRWVLRSLESSPLDVPPAS